MVIKPEYFKSIIFGIEDSLVSTTGLIAGLSVGSESRRFVILGGIIAIIVEAVSMGAGEYISDDAVQEMDHKKIRADSPAKSGVLMFFSYLIAGLVPLWPFLVFVPSTALVISISSAFVALFLLGYIKGRFLNIHPYKSGFKILVVGGVATLLGVVVGLILKI